MLNVTRAVFGRTDRKVQAAPLYQWDFGQILQFEGLDLPSNFEAHFSNTPLTGTAITVIGSDDQANIPDSLLQTGNDIWCWVYLHEEETDGETEYCAVIPVNARPQRDGSEPTPEQADAIATAIEALNEATAVLDDAIAHTETYRDEAEAYATQAESWAIGGTGTRDHEDTDNAKYYKDQAEETAQRVTDAVDYFVDTTVPQAIQSVGDEGTAQIALVDAEGTAQIGAVGNAGTAQIALVGAEGTRQVGIVSGEGTTQKGNVSAEGSTQIGRVQSEGSTQIGYVESAGTTQVGNVNSAGTTQVGLVQSAGSAQIGLVQAEGTAQISAVGNAGTAQIGLVEAKGTEQIGLVEAEGATQIAAVEAKGEEVLSEMIDKAPIITDTASGAIASFPDGTNAPIKQLTVGIAPVQDLHGYENPWPAGGGKNLFSSNVFRDGVLASMSSATDDPTNRTVTFSANAAVEQPITNGLTFKENTQYTFIITLSKNSGTPSNLRVYYTDDTYTSIPSVSATDTKETVTQTTVAGKTVSRLTKTNQQGNTTIYYDKSGIFEGASQPFSPWENLCPITGWTGATVYRSGKNLWGGQPFADAILSSCTSAATQSGNIVTLPNGGNNVQSSTANRAKMFENQFQDGSYTIIIGQPTDSESTLMNKSLITAFYTDGTSTSITAGHYDSTNKLWRYVSNASKKLRFLRMNRDESSRQEYDLTRMGIFQGNVSIEQFEAYNGAIYPITWENAGTVYGGTLTVEQDGTGTLTVTHYCETTAALTARTWYTATSGGRTYVRARATSLMTEERAAMICSHYKYAGTGTTIYENEVRDMIGNYYNICFCDTAHYTTEAQFKAYLQAQETAGTPVQLYHLYATPQTYTLTAAEMTTLFGQNNWWADTGDVSVNYRADTKLYIDKKLAALIAALS